MSAWAKAEAPPDERALYAHSRFLVTLDLGRGYSFVGHGVRGRRRAFDAFAMAVLARFREPASFASAGAAIAAEVEGGRLTAPAWLAKDGAGAPRALAAGLSAFCRELAELGLIVPVEVDEEAALAAEMRRRYTAGYERAFGLDAIEDAFEPLVGVGLGFDARAGSGAGAADGAADGVADGAASLERVRFLVLGWCLAQAVRPLLRELGRARGLAVEVEVGFPADVALAARLAPDATVLQLSHRLILAPLLDGFASADAASIARRSEAAEDEVRRAVAEALARRPAGSLLLVQGIALPQTSPLGLEDARAPLGAFEAIRRVNRAACEALASAPDALFVDEDAIAASWGKRWLLDDLISTYSHHGFREHHAAEPASEPAAEPAGDEGAGAGAARGGGAERGPFGPEALPARYQRLLAGAYLDLYEAWRGRGQVRVVAVDLDGTLWPGEIADEGFSFESEALTVPLMYGRWGGLHEALRILERRGILLAVVSKNEREQVLARWRPEAVPLALGATAADTRHYLGPDAFVALEIGWGPKSEAIRRLAARLEVRLEQVAFIDDSALERAEVRANAPGVLVLGDDPLAIRETLLTSPRFAVFGRSSEARGRTETTRARLERDAARASAPDRAAFLRGLEVRARFERVRDPARLARAAELLQRTTQLHTSAARPTLGDLEALLAEGGEVVAMDLRDRLADYGFVGVAVVAGGEVRALAVSCRVIGLEAEPALLRRAVLLARPRAGGAARAGAASAGAAGDGAASGASGEAAARGERVLVRFRRTDRNLPALRLLERPGLAADPRGEGYLADPRAEVFASDPAHLAVLDDLAATAGLAALAGPTGAGSISGARGASAG